MDINKILAEYDAMFGNYELEEIEAFLKNNIENAIDMGDYGSMITLLNEMIGFCRDTTQRDKALNYCDSLLNVMNQMDLQGRVDYATSLLNIANAYRAFGLWKESLALYEEVYDIYIENLESSSFSYASLYNNWSLVYQEMKHYEKAKELLLKALMIVDLYENAVIPQANTRTNLAATLIQIGTQESYEEAMQYLQEALEVYERDGGRDFHYGAALVAMGDAHFSKKEYEMAAEYYKRGMDEIEHHVGKTDNYTRVQEKYELCQRYIETKDSAESYEEGMDPEKSHYDNVNIEENERNNVDRCTNNLKACQEFYEEYGKRMIHEYFPEYETRIAVGLVGEGSDCFGFDDSISMDHDYGIGFCMWLTEQDYAEIGSKLQKRYEQMLSDYKSQLNQPLADEGDVVSNNLDEGHSLFLQQRRGVFSINDFCNRILDTHLNYEENDAIDYLAVNEEKLATFINGKIFSDELGVFLAIREKVQQYYPDKVWRLRLAQSLHEFAQYAQCNYSRMMARKDYVTATVCIGKAVESAMDIVYLLNRTYAPYYKWKKKGLSKLSKLQDLIPILEELVLLPIQKEAWEKRTYNSVSINKDDKCVCLFEQVADQLLRELQNQDLVKGNDTFLESYCQQLIKGKYMEIIERIVDLEWSQFDKVKNEGGRACCQDDFATFSVMRKSQYMTWDEELLTSYYNDLLEADNKGWNLIMEKYARMMKTTAPEKYAELEAELPVRNDQRIAIQEEIIRIQVAWMEEFASKYPKMADNARSIHTSEDNEYNTSYETYLRGELGTYSDTTFVLYGRFITALMQKGKNLAYETMSNTAKLYGYESLEDAERRMW